MHDHNTSQLVQIAAPLRPQVQRIPHAQKPHDHVTKFLVGLDIGSTTVKAVIVDAATDQVLWQDYQRHETKQPEKSLEFLKRMEAEVGIDRKNTRMFVTGSGGGGIAEQVGAKFVQEVTAVSLAVEKLHPEVYSVIELGGQDAKIIVFKDDDETGRKKKIPSMNDKCAGGTGAVIDKINAAAIAYGLVVVVSAGVLVLAVSSLSRNSRYVGIIWIGLWIVSNIAGEVLRETAHVKWGPLVSYTGNLERIGESLLDTEAAWHQIGSLVTAGGGRSDLSTWQQPYPWSWSLGVLLGLFGLSICILSLRVRTLDRLR